MKSLSAKKGIFMLTVTQLARQFGISRATLLYYEREGLLTPAGRSENGYRWYGEKEVSLLGDIVAYRAYGLPIASIKSLISQKAQTQPQILKAHFNALEREIQVLKAQQKAIVALLQEPYLLEENIVNKERWTQIMAASGFSENDMVKWHQTFEQMEPEEHQKFLESLGIAQDEIVRIRAL